MTRIRVMTETCVFLFGLRTENKVKRTINQHAYTHTYDQPFPRYFWRLVIVSSWPYFVVVFYMRWAVKLRVVVDRILHVFYLIFNCMLNDSKIIQNAPRKKAQV